MHTMFFRKFMNTDHIHYRYTFRDSGNHFNSSIDGFENGVGGGTGWLVTTAPVVAGETIVLQFTIGDVGDGEWDSTVLIDNFAWGVDNLVTPETQQ